jgi:Flp pilus assembly protein TadG
MDRRPERRSSRTAALGRPRAANRQWRERGAAAVEFALVMPLLLILVLGIAEFGRAYNIQTTLSAAAREGARVMALQSSQSDARQAAIAAADPAVTLSAGQISVSPSTCVGTAASAVVTVTYQLTFITNFFGTPPIALEGRGVMRCNG